MRRHDSDNSNRISDMSSSDNFRGSSSHHNQYSTAHNNVRNGSNYYDGRYGEDEEYGGEQFTDEDLGYNNSHDVGHYDNNSTAMGGRSTVHGDVNDGYLEDEYDAYAEDDDERFEDEELLLEPPRDDPNGIQMEASYSTIHTNADNKLDDSYIQQSPRGGGGVGGGDGGTATTAPQSTHDPRVAFVDSDGFKYDERGEIILDEGEDNVDLAYEEGEYVNLQQDQRSVDRSVRKSRIRLPGGKRSTVYFLTCVGISSAIAIAGGLYLTIFWIYYAKGYNIPDPPTTASKQISQPTLSPTTSPVSPPTMPPSSELQRPECTLCEDGSTANLLLQSNTTGYFCSDLSQYVETLDADEEECGYMRTIGVSECGCWSVSAPLFNNNP